jgi:hypothetical protein
MKTHYEHLCVMLGIPFPHVHYTEKQFVGLMGKLMFASGMSPEDLGQSEMVEVETMSRFHKYGKKIYRVANEFSDTIEKVAINLPTSRLVRANDSFCIHFPERRVTIDPETGEFSTNCVYVTSIKIEEEHIGYTFYVPQKVGEGYDGTYRFFSVNTLKSSCADIDGLIRDVKNAKGVPASDSLKSFARYIFNIILYIYSGEPDLRLLKGKVSKKKPKDLKKWHRKHRDMSQVDVTLVGFNFKKPKQYTVDGTIVTGHWRWQPYGPERQLVKLIWIDSHERSFK